MIDYPAIKAVHVASVALSGTLLAVRGAWRLVRPDARFAQSMRILPPVIDTVLLLSALALLAVWMERGAPLDWVVAKVLALVVYIGLGIVALRPGLRRRPRLVALGAAAAAFGYIVAVALTKSPAGALRWFVST